MVCWVLLLFGDLFVFGLGFFFFGLVFLFVVWLWVFFACCHPFPQSSILVKRLRNISVAGVEEGKTQAEVLLLKNVA